MKRSPEQEAALSVSERDLQRAVCQYLDLKGALYYAVPNGQMRRGSRPEIGLRAGVPDLGVCEPRVDRFTGRTFGALYLELKTRSGRISQSQKAWLSALRAVGNRSVVVRTFDEAKAAIDLYLGYRALLPDESRAGAG